MADADDRRRPPSRGHATQEVDTNLQLQAQLNCFFSAQRKWQHELEAKISQQLEELRGRQPMDPMPGPASAVPENVGRSRACFNCGRTCHLARQCHRPRRSTGRPPDAHTSAPEDADRDDPVVMNHTNREHLLALTNNAIYIQVMVHDRARLCLIDTCSQVSIVPFTLVDGLELHPSSRILLAANGVEIRILGEAVVPPKMFRGFDISTKFLVSDQIFEPMLGMDWLHWVWHWSAICWETTHTAGQGERVVLVSEGGGRGRADCAT